VYRIVFDRNTEVVSAKFSWRRGPRSLVDRLFRGFGRKLTAGLAG
jgi:hypothetical protein